MRLLDKKTIEVEKSNERKRDIDEGVKLAKSIDSLRETHTKEQANLRLFRDSILKSIKSEIDVLTLQKNNLIAEIEALNRRNERAKIDIIKKLKQILK